MRLTDGTRVVCFDATQRADARREGTNLFTVRLRDYCIDKDTNYA